MFWFYLFPMIVCGGTTITFVVYEWNKKGFIEGDDLGMIATSFVPLINWVLLIIIGIAVFSDVFDSKKKYFVRKSK